MSHIRAIPTRYNGVNFRSRLEARWAAFFDLVGWRWEYEPIDLKGWAPDFIIKLPIADVYAEVKPVETIEHPEIKGLWLLPQESTAWQKTRPHDCASFVLHLGARPQSSNYCSIGRLTDGKPVGDVLWIDVESTLRVKDADSIWREAGNIVQWQGL